MLSEPRDERQTHRHRLPATGGVCLATALLPAPHHMSEYEVGQSVRTLADVRDDDRLVVIPEGESAMVIGFAGRNLVLSWLDPDTGATIDAVSDPWNVRRITPRAVR